MTVSYDYFDESYFQLGKERGTAYNDYLNASRSSATYPEIASVVAEVFRPKRVLEIGCATGIIVRYLNEMGIEAHCIDVSEWAIANREHRNVIHAGAELLPYPDGYFDLVYSVHAIEHIPRALKDKAFAEMSRVCGGGVQFHLLPIIGLGPYVGAREDVVEALLKDPTHNLIEDYEWWINEFAATGYSDVHASIYFSNDPSIDLSASQLLLSRTVASSEMLAKIQQRNIRVLKEYSQRAKREFQRAEQAEIGRFSNLGANELSGMAWKKLPSAWADVEFFPDRLRFDPDFRATASVEIKSGDGAIVPLRFSFISDDGAEADIWREFPVGMTQFQFRLGELTARRGDFSGGAISKIYFGGSGNGEFRVQLSIHDGKSLYFSG